jgi:hypothetical protein
MAISLIALFATAIFCRQPAAAQVVRPDPAETIAVEKANASLSPNVAFDKLGAKAGKWHVENGTLRQADRAEMYGRTFIEGPRWLDCIIKAKVRIDAVGGPAASNGARLIVRANPKTDTFYTIGLWAGSREVRIEKSRGLAFEPMKSDNVSAIMAAPFPVELGKTYEVTVVVDRATIYCYIDGKFAVLAQEQDFTIQPVGQVGFFTSNATAAFSDVSVKGLYGVTASPVVPFAGNPLNIAVYSPAVLKDGKYRMWDSLLGRYAESVDGITWTWPAGKESVVNRGNKGDWPTGNQCGDPDVLKFDGQYWITYWSTCNRRNQAFDGMGLKRSPDGIHWTPEPANPVFYMGPNGDWDEMVVGDHAMIRDGDRFKLWYVGITRGHRGYRNEFGYAESKDCIHWRKCRLNPILTQGKPGTWDGGWIYAAGVVKVDDEQSASHVYAGKSGASYHLFYTGQPTNNEVICGVKRIGYAFSLDGVHWVKWNDPKTTDPPFQDSDPVLGWSDYRQKGFTGVGASTAVRVGDEVRIYYTMYEERKDLQGPELVAGTGFATVKIDVLRKIAAEAKARGLLACATRAEIDAVMDEPLPQSMWDDLQAHVFSAIQAKQAGNPNREKAALAEIAATRGKFTKSLERHYAGPFAALKKVVEALEAGRPVSEKTLWTLPNDRAGKTASPIELKDLNIAAAQHPMMIEFEALCDRFELGHVAWSTGDGFQPGQAIEFMAGYPTAKTPTHRVTIATDGKPLDALRFHFPGKADLKQVRIRQIVLP